MDSESVQTPPSPAWDRGVNELLIGLTELSILLAQEVCMHFCEVLWARFIYSNK